jgi:hypothetical protein
LVKHIPGPPKTQGLPQPEEYAEVPVEMLDKVFRLPRIYDPRHPEADKDGRRTAHPREHAEARKQEAGGSEPDTEHSVWDWG